MASKTAKENNVARLDAKTLKERSRRTDRVIVWLVGFVLLLLLVGLWAGSYFVWDRNNLEVGGHTGGDTIVGYILGILTLIFFGITAGYSLRHGRRRQKNMMMRTWMEMHIVCGVLAGIAAILHSGPKFGAPIHGAFLLSFLFLVGTGILGKFLFVAIPKKLSNLEDDAMLYEDVVDRRKAADVKRDELLEAANENVKNAFQAAAKNLKNMNTHATEYKKSESRKEKGMTLQKYLVEYLYLKANSDTAVEGRDRDTLRALLLTEVQQAIYAQQMKYHNVLRFWLPTHIALTTLCLPWLVLHVITVFLL